ncbi:MAG: FixH family protein [Pseudomonadota bacterium]
MQEIKGRHVLIGFTAAFGIIIAVNVTMAVNAVRTFPGLTTKNSYVASQAFEGDRQSQAALGWTIEAKVEGSSLALRVSDENGAVFPVFDSARFGRPTHVKNDQDLEFDLVDGKFLAPVTTAPGQWQLDLNLRAVDGTPFRQSIDIWVPNS